MIYLTEIIGQDYYSHFTLLFDQPSVMSNGKELNSRYIARFQNPQTRERWTWVHEAIETAKKSNDECQLTEALESEALRQCAFRTGS